MSDNMKREAVTVGGPDASDLTRIAAVQGTDTSGAEEGLVVREARQRRIKNTFAAINAAGQQSQPLDVSSVSPKAHTLSIAPANATSYSYELQGAIDANWASLTGAQQVPDGSPNMVSVEGRPVDQVRVNVIDLQGTNASLVPTYLGVA